MCYYLQRISFWVWCVCIEHNASANQHLYDPLPPPPQQQQNQQQQKPIRTLFPSLCNLTLSISPIQNKLDLNIVYKILIIKVKNGNVIMKEIFSKHICKHSHTSVNCIIAFSVAIRRQQQDMRSKEKRFKKDLKHSLFT